MQVYRKKKPQYIIHIDTSTPKHLNIHVKLVQV